MYFLGNLVEIVAYIFDILYCWHYFALAILESKQRDIFTMNKEEFILCLHIQNQILQQT